MAPVKPRLETALRFEMVSDEGRALLNSYLVATLLAVLWLLVVRFGPTRPATSAENPEDRRVTVVVQPPEAVVRSFVPTVNERGARGLITPRGVSSDDIRNVFGGDLRLVDAQRLLRGIEVTASGAAAHEHARKVGLETGIGSRTPGLNRGEAGAHVASGVGVVRGNGVSRASLVVAPPEVRPAGPGTGAGDVVEVGQAVRAHVPQLERCYYEEGLTRNASLAGLVRLSMEVEAGQVRAARVVERSWSGAGVAETERCLERTARQWRLGESSARIVVPLSFTAPARARR
jgi:hypothetical protein